jgi:hypothetical protein
MTLLNQAIHFTEEEKIKREKEYVPTHSLENQRKIQLL